MDVMLVDTDGEEIVTLSLPVVPIKGDYITLFGKNYLIKERCLIVYSEIGKIDKFMLSVEVIN
jgi:hypothetical protein